jgi:hypothetical protein
LSVCVCARARARATFPKELCFVLIPFQTDKLVRY